ncbi:probable serine/threonine-protein kinase kinX isoform X5 [Oncorhynchus mykiss]|uniref:probable serine/threonine-protein kinase kinX isoform X5 n=1 Tax=Oncorhynchus mykiss TaxID=8022 RepID=UPI001877B7B9|nr:probable serine/threonine-protein kinase kinX isoform X5 [Oncorhynchus mykiss]
MGNEHSKNKGHTKDKSEQALDKHPEGEVNNHAVSILYDGLENSDTSEAAVEQNSQPSSRPPAKEPGIVEANGSGCAPVVVEQEPVIENVPEAEAETAKPKTIPEPEPNHQKKEPKESSKERVNVFDNLFKKKATPQPNPDPAPEKEEPIKEKTVEESKSSPEVSVTVTDGIHDEASEVLMAAHLFPKQLEVRFSFPEAESELSSLLDFLTADSIQITTESSEEQPTEESVSPPEEETTEPVFGEEPTEDTTVEKSPVPKEELGEIAYVLENEAAIYSAITEELEELEEIADALENEAAVDSAIAEELEELEEIADALENEAAVDSAIAAELEELEEITDVLENEAAMYSATAEELEELEEIADVPEDVAAIESEELESSPSAKETTEKNKKNDERKETSDSSSRLLGQLQSACMKIIKESVYSPVRVCIEMSAEGCGTINITIQLSLRQRGDLKCEDETSAETALDME